MILTAFIVNLIERIINVSIFNVFNRSSFGNGVFAEDYQKMTCQLVSFIQGHLIQNMLENSGIPKQVAENVDTGVNVDNIDIDLMYSGVIFQSENCHNWIHQ